MSALLTGCGEKTKSSSNPSGICEIAQEQMLDSAKVISGCKAYVSMPGLDSENDRYAEQFRKINASAIHKCNPHFKDGDKWPPVMEAVRNWQLACYTLMLVLNESKFNKYPAHAIVDQFDKRVKEVKTTENAIKKHCPNLSLVDFKSK